MEFDDVVKLRKSVRSFKDKVPSWKLILEAVDSACVGPFADGKNHLKFIIIEDEKSIGEIAKISAQTWINQAPILVVVCSDDAILENMHSERGRVYSRQQAGSAIVTFMLKLTDMKIGSCWVGSYSDEELRGLLKIPKNIQIEAVIPIGYEKEKSKKKEKKDLENAIFWEVWEKRKKPSFTSEQKDSQGIEW